MNGLGFCQNPKNIYFGDIFGTFWAPLTRRNFVYDMILFSGLK